MFENPRRGRQGKKFTKYVPKILDLKSSSEQKFSENWRWGACPYSERVLSDTIQEDKYFIPFGLTKYVFIASSSKQ